MRQLIVQVHCALIKQRGRPRKRLRVHSADSPVRPTSIAFVTPCAACHQQPIRVILPGGVNKSSEIDFTRWYHKIKRVGLEERAGVPDSEAAVLPTPDKRSVGQENFDFFRTAFTKVEGSGIRVLLQQGAFTKVHWELTRRGREFVDVALLQDNSVVAVECDVARVVSLPNLNSCSDP